MSEETKTMQRIKNAGTVAQTARRALKLALLLKEVINVEHKEWPDTPLPPTTVTTTTTFFNCNKIAEGADYTDRNGRSIKCSSFSLKGLIYFNVAATRSVFRLICFVDNGHDGATPAIGDLLLGTPLVNADRAPDPNDRSRYRVLMDKRFWLNVSQPIQFLDFKHAVKHHILFDGTAATDYAHGSIWIAAMSDEATNGPSVELESRLRFVDN
jgi:hypothetical protein